MRGRGRGRKRGEREEREGEKLSWDEVGILFAFNSTPSDREGVEGGTDKLSWDGG